MTTVGAVAEQQKEAVTTLTAEVHEETTAQGLWWGELLRGLAITAIGLGIVFWPVGTLATFVYFAAGLAIALGIFDIVRGIFTIGRNWVWVGSVVLGILAIILGVFVFRNPVTSLVGFIYLLGGYFIVSGFLALFTRGHGNGTRALSSLYGVLTIILGVIIILNPVVGGATYYWISGIFALIAGPVLIAMSFRLKNEQAREAQEVETHAARGRRPVHA